MAHYKVIDADGHVRESIAGLREFLEPRGNGAISFPTTRGIVTCAVSWAHSPTDPKISWRRWTRTVST